MFKANKYTAQSLGTLNLIQFNLIYKYLPSLLKKLKFLKSEFICGTYRLVLIKDDVELILELALLLILSCLFSNPWFSFAVENTIKITNKMFMLAADPEVIINVVIARILLIMPDHQGIKLIWVSLHTTHLQPPPQEEQKIWESVFWRAKGLSGFEKYLLCMYYIVCKYVSKQVST